MPASSAENFGQIEETIKSSLSGRESVFDSKLTSFSKQVLLQDIEFKPAQNRYSLQIDSLRSKYIPLNASKSYSSVNKQNGHNTGKIVHEVFHALTCVFLKRNDN